MQVICSILNDQTDVKFADDTYLVIPAASADTRVAELGHIAAWAADNNLRLNKSKTREVVFYDNRQPASTPYPAAAATARHHP